MHPLLQNLSVFTWMDVIDSNEKCISLLQDLGLIPEKTDTAPTCRKCSSRMSVHNSATYMIGWKWKCTKGRGKNKDRCCGSINPLEGTFFENHHVPVTDVLALMFGYLFNMTYTEMKDHIDCWRRNHKRKQMGKQTILDMYSRFKEIILTVLKKRGEATENLENADRSKIFKIYTKTMEVEPFFRNLVYRFLMDVKCEFPCLLNKPVRDFANMPASTSSSSVSDVPPPKIPDTPPVTTSASETDTTSETPNLSNSADVSTPASARSVSREIGKRKTFKSNAPLPSVSTPKDNTPTLENAQILTSCTSAVGNVHTLNRSAMGIMQTSNNSNDAIQILDNNSSAVSSAFTIGSDILGENLKESVFDDIDPFADENMDIAEIVVQTTE